MFSASLSDFIHKVWSVVFVSEISLQHLLGGNGLISGANVHWHSIKKKCEIAGNDSKKCFHIKRPGTGQVKIKR